MMSSSAYAKRESCDGNKKGSIVTDKTFHKKLTSSLRSNIHTMNSRNFGKELSLNEQRKITIGYDHLVFIGNGASLELLPEIEFSKYSKWSYDHILNSSILDSSINDLRNTLTSRISSNKVLFIIISDISMIGSTEKLPECLIKRCNQQLTYTRLSNNLESIKVKVKNLVHHLKVIISKIKKHFDIISKFIVAPFTPRVYIHISNTGIIFLHSKMHDYIKNLECTCFIRGEIGDILNLFDDSLVIYEAEWRTLTNFISLEDNGAISATINSIPSKYYNKNLKSIVWRNLSLNSYDNSDFKTIFEWKSCIEQLALKILKSSAETLRDADCKSVNQPSNHKKFMSLQFSSVMPELKRNLILGNELKHKNSRTEIAPQGRFLKNLDMLPMNFSTISYNTPLFPVKVLASSTSSDNIENTYVELKTADKDVGLVHDRTMEFEHIKTNCEESKLSVIYDKKVSEEDKKLSDYVSQKKECEGNLAYVELNTLDSTVDVLSNEEFIKRQSNMIVEINNESSTINDIGDSSQKNVSITHIENCNMAKSINDEQTFELVSTTSQKLLPCEKAELAKTSSYNNEADLLSPTCLPDNILNVKDSIAFNVASKNCSSDNQYQCLQTEFVNSEVKVSYDHVIFIGNGDSFNILPNFDCNHTTWCYKDIFENKLLHSMIADLKLALSSKVLFLLISDVSMIGCTEKLPACLDKKCTEPLTFIKKLPIFNSFTSQMKDCFMLIKNFIVEIINCQAIQASVTLLPFTPRAYVHISNIIYFENFFHSKMHYHLSYINNICFLSGNTQIEWGDALAKFGKKWNKLSQFISQTDENLKSIISSFFGKPFNSITWKNVSFSSMDETDKDILTNWRSCITSIVESAPSSSSNLSSILTYCEGVQKLSSSYISQEENLSVVDLISPQDHFISQVKLSNSFCDYNQFEEEGYWVQCARADKCLSNLHSESIPFEQDAYWVKEIFPFEFSGCTVPVDGESNTNALKDLDLSKNEIERKKYIETDINFNFSIEDSYNGKFQNVSQNLALHAFSNPDYNVTINELEGVESKMNVSDLQACQEQNEVISNEHEDIINGIFSPTEGDVDSLLYIEKLEVTQIFNNEDKVFTDPETSETLKKNLLIETEYQKSQNYTISDKDYPCIESVSLDEANRQLNISNDNAFDNLVFIGNGDSLEMVPEIEFCKYSKWHFDDIVDNDALQAKFCALNKITSKGLIFFILSDISMVANCQKMPKCLIKKCKKPLSFNLQFNSLELLSNIQNCILFIKNIISDIKKFLNNKVKIIVAPFAPRTYIHNSNSVICDNLFHSKMHEYWEKFNCTTFLYGNTQKTWKEALLTFEAEWKNLVQFVPQEVYKDIQLIKVISSYTSKKFKNISWRKINSSCLNDVDNEVISEWKLCIKLLALMVWEDSSNSLDSVSISIDKLASMAMSRKLAMIPSLSLSCNEKMKDPEANVNKPPSLKEDVRHCERGNFENLKDSLVNFRRTWGKYKLPTFDKSLSYSKNKWRSRSCSRLNSKTNTLVPFRKNRRSLSLYCHQGCNMSCSRSSFIDRINIIKRTENLNLNRSHSKSVFSIVSSHSLSIERCRKSHSRRSSLLSDVSSISWSSAKCKSSNNMDDNLSLSSISSCDVSSAICKSVNDSDDNISLSSISSCISNISPCINNKSKINYCPNSNYAAENSKYKNKSICSLPSNEQKYRSQSKSLQSQIKNSIKCKPLFSRQESVTKSKSTKHSNSKPLYFNRSLSKSRSKSPCHQRKSTESSDKYNKKSRSKSPSYKWSSSRNSIKYSKRSRSKSAKLKSRHCQSRSKSPLQKRKALEKSVKCNNISKSIHLKPRQSKNVRSNRSYSKSCSISPCYKMELLSHSTKCNRKSRSKSNTKSKSCYSKSRTKSPCNYNSSRSKIELNCGRSRSKSPCYKVKMNGMENANDFQPCCSNSSKLVKNCRRAISQNIDDEHFNKYSEFISQESDLSSTVPPSKKSRYLETLPLVKQESSTVNARSVVQIDYREQSEVESFQEYRNALTKLKNEFEVKYSVFKCIPKFHPYYQQYYETFSALYVIQRGNYNDDEDKENLWNLFWQSKFDEIKNDDWQMQEQLLKKELEKKTALRPPLQSFTPTPQVSLHLEEPSYSFEETLTLLERLSDKFLFHGEAVKTLISICRNLGTTSTVAYKVFMESENIKLMNVLLRKLKILSLTTSGDDVFLIKRVINWIPKLLDEAKEKISLKSVLEEIPIDLESIADESVGKDSEFILKRIENALFEKGLLHPNSQLIDDLFLKVCAIQFSRLMKKGKF